MSKFKCLSRSDRYDELPEDRRLLTRPRKAKKKHKKKKKPLVQRRKNREKSVSTKWTAKIRMASLRAMGFKSYKSYLKSDLWRDIRLAVLSRKSTCIRCGESADQVHHGSYAEFVMRGNAPEYLHPVCDDCHRQAEFIGDKKTTIEVANQRLGISSIGWRKL